MEFKWSFHHRLNMPTVVYTSPGLSRTSNQVPDAVVFTAVTDASLGTVYTSNAVTITGIGADTRPPISVVNGTYSINGGSYTSNPGKVQLQDVVRVRQTASSASGTETNTILTIADATFNYSVTTIGSSPQSPVIEQPDHASVLLGNTFSYTPTLTLGSDVFWYKEYGPDDLTVDQETGEITWDTSNMPRGRGFAVGLACSNAAGEDIKWFAIHLDNTGSSVMRVMGTDTIATTIRAACAELNGGDTLVIPAGHYWASTTSTDSYENTFADTNGGAMPQGTDSQHTTLVSPGGGVIDGSPHDGIGRQTDAGFEMVSGQATLRQYVSVVMLEWKGSERQSIMVNADNIHMEFVGAADCSYGLSPTTFAEADPGDASVAGGYITGDNSVWENSYAYGAWRYGLQRGLDTTGCLTHRNIVRPDDYDGDQPRGGITHYRCDNVGAYNNFVIDGNREDLVPFYKNYAGAFTIPATGNNAFATNVDFNANMALNTHMLWSLNDNTTSTNMSNANMVSVACRSTITPQTASVSPMVLGTSQRMTITNSGIYRPESWDDSDIGSVILSRSDERVDVTNCIIHQPGWDASAGSTIAVGTLLAGDAGDLTGNNIFDNSDSNISTGGSETGTTTLNSLNNGWDYPPRVEAGSPLEGKGPDMTNFKSPSHRMPTDADWQTETNIWAWPHPGETYIRERMRDYSKTNLPVRNTTHQQNPVLFNGTITGERGFCASGESFSEYVWGYFGRTVPPLRTSAKLTGANEITFRVGKYRSNRGDTIQKFNVYISTDMNTPVLTFTGLKGVLTGASAGTNTYYIRAVDNSKVGAYGANETGESGNSRALVVANDEFRVANLTPNGGVVTGQWTETGGGNAGSGIAWIEDENRFLICRNNIRTLYEYQSDLDTFIRSVNIFNNWNDIEDLCWMGNNEIATCSENAGGYHVEVYDYSTSNIVLKQWLEIAVPSAPNNSGAEGVTWCPSRNCWYVVGEGQQSGADRRFFKVTRPTNTTTDYNYNDSELVVEEPWVAETVFNSYGSTGAAFDFSAITYHAATDTVLILSHTGQMIVQVRPETGEIVSDYSLPNNEQWEGIDFINNGNDLIITAEGAQFQLFSAG